MECGGEEEDRWHELWWYRAEIPALVGRKQEDGEFKATLSYEVKPCLRKPKRSTKSKTETNKQPTNKVQGRKEERAEGPWVNSDSI